MSHDKLNRDDKGQLAMVVYVKNNHLYIDFGKDLSWLALHKKETEAWIKTLQEKVKLLKD